MSNKGISGWYYNKIDVNAFDLPNDIILSNFSSWSMSAKDKTEEKRAHKDTDLWKKKALWESSRCVNKMCK